MKILKNSSRMKFIAIGTRTIELYLDWFIQFRSILMRFVLIGGRKWRYGCHVVLLVTLFNRKCIIIDQS